MVTMQSDTLGGGLGEQAIQNSLPFVHTLSSLHMYVGTSYNTVPTAAAVYVHAKINGWSKGQSDGLKQSQIKSTNFPMYL